MFLSKSKATLVLVKYTSTKLGIHRSSEIEMFALSKKNPENNDETEAPSNKKKTYYETGFLPNN